MSGCCGRIRSADAIVSWPAGAILSPGRPAARTLMPLRRQGRFAGRCGARGVQRRQQGHPYCGVQRLTRPTLLAAGQGAQDPARLSSRLDQAAADEALVCRPSSRCRTSSRELPPGGEEDYHRAFGRSAPSRRWPNPLDHLETRITARGYRRRAWRQGQRVPLLLPDRGRSAPGARAAPARRGPSRVWKLA